MGLEPGLMCYAGAAGGGLTLDATMPASIKHVLKDTDTHPEEICRVEAGRIPNQSFCPHGVGVCPASGIRLNSC